MQKKVTLVVLFFFLTGFRLFAQQIYEPTPRDTEFITSLQSFVDNLERQYKPQYQQYVDTLKTIWLSGRLQEEQKQLVYFTMGMFSNMRLKPWPEHALYIEGLVKVMSTRHRDSNFENWHNGFKGLLNTQSQRILISLWEKSIKLFDSNTLFTSSTVRWRLNSDDYKLVVEEGGLKVQFSGNDLKGFSQGDSLIIYNTSGAVDMMSDKFSGRGGRFTWERVKLDPEKVFANMSTYQLDLSIARMEADSVAFHNYGFFQHALAGKLTDRLIADVKPENASFPQFDSYQSIHEINGIFQGIDYRGGFSMSGQKVLGSGTRYGDATLKFYRADSLYVTARSNVFVIRNDRITADNAAISIYLSGDSIYHPGLTTRYFNPTREVSFQRDEKGTSRAPFFNTFHMLDMYCEAINWKVDEYNMEMKMIRGMSTEGQALFESLDFFSDLRYMRMQAISGLHPLIRLRNFSVEYNSRTFPIREYAGYVRSEVTNVTSQLIAFSQNGFLSFNSENATVTLYDKLFHYITSYVGNSDYDVIQINSIAPVNARLNMNNFDLHLLGVEKIPLSDDKNVVLYPTDQEVIMKKNRDIYFAGKIESGLFDFFGKEFYFDYHLFKINLVDTDSMSFRVRSFDPDSRGNYTDVRVRTVLEGINGELLVDHPRNKSGRMPYPRYPIFSSNNESFVFYDREFVQDGVYDRNNVFFKLIPFSIDSLDNATTDNIAFDGVFISTGIFPDFYDYLTVQKDYSLGFNTKTPDEGYDIYGDKAKYTGPINMSYEGLRTDGQLKYLNSTVEASHMLMFPDSARAKVRTFHLSAENAPIEYPEVSAKEVNMLYMPHDDNLTISKVAEPIGIFEGLAQMHGSIGLTPEGLTGKGTMNFFGAEMRSQDFDYKRNDFTAESSYLKLLAKDGKATALEAHNYDSYVNMAAGNSKLKAINTDSKIAFNLNRYEGFSFDFDWDMNAGKLKMQNSLQGQMASGGTLSPKEWIAQDFKGHELISVHPTQDSLRFFAGRVDYNLDDNTIYAQEVNIVKVADAAIFPDNKEVFVLPGAEIRKLENAVIVANTSTLHHQFYEAEANITSRKFYSGKGTYDYTDEAGNVQPIFFESVSVDRESLTTVALSKLYKEHEFTLSPRFGYIGDINLKAENPNFYYNGSAQILLDCGPLASNWVKFEAELKKDSIFIPIGDDLKNEANGSVRSALMLAGDSIHIYPAIFGRQKHYSDIEIISAKGYLTFDKFAGQYLISTAEKLANDNLPDNIIRINPNTCTLTGDGIINLGEDFGQFKLSNFGQISHNYNDNKVNLDIVMGIDFFFANNALTLAENSIKTREDLSPVNLNRRKYIGYLQKKTGNETALRLMDEISLAGSFRRFPPELVHTFFLADVKMKWDQDLQTFYSTDPIGVGNMSSSNINRYVDGFAEIKKQRGGDIFNLAIVPGGLADEGIGVEWYFFYYSRGTMQAIASSTDFNNIVRDVKPKNRRLEGARGQEAFVFILSSDRRPFDFVREMRQLQQN